jgi:putative membrane protein
LYVFSTAAHSGLLGALLTFATAVIYPAYAETAPAFGLTALEDQQLGGLIMWIPAGVLYTIAALALLAGWMREAEERAAKRDELESYSGKLIGGEENA